MKEEHSTITYKGKVVFYRMDATAPARDLKPFQENEACFMFVNHGEFSIRTPDKLIKFEKDQGMLAKCFNFFFESTEQQRSDFEKMGFLGVFLFPEHVESLLNIDLSSSTKTVDYNLKKIPLDGLFNSFRDSVNILIDNPELMDDLMIETKIKEFVLLISRSQNMSPVDFLASMFKLNATSFKSTIQNNLYSNLSVDEFAQLCAMSLSSFKRRFKEDFGESPKKYISKMKLQKAVDLLKQSSERISDIAYDCGYETISTFNRSFKSEHGISPTDFRSNQKLN